MPTQQITRLTPSHWFTFLNWLTAAASLAALAVFIIDYGFYLTTAQKLTVQISYGVLAGIFVAASMICRRCTTGSSCGPISAGCSAASSSDADGSVSLRRDCGCRGGDGIQIAPVDVVLLCA